MFEIDQTVWLEFQQGFTGNLVLDWCAIGVLGFLFFGLICWAAKC